MSTDTTITGLARLLVAENLLEREVALAAFTTADKNGTPLVRHLVKNRLIDSKVIAKTASQEFGLPLLDISAMDPTAFPLGQVDSKLLQKHNMLPILKKGHKMFLAVSDPSNQTGIDEIKFNTGSSIDLIVVEDDKLHQLIESLVKSPEEEAEVDNAVDGLTAMMEPLIMAVLGVLVGGLMIAMYLPIFQIGSVV